MLPEALCTELRADIRRFLTGQQTYARYGVPWRRGLLLVGPPGNGKTHTIKALVKEAGVACLYVRSLQPSHGTQDRTLHRVFAKARADAPCLLVFEDLDALVTDGNRSVFLNELDGFAANRGVLTIATTNHAHRLDPALVDRPGRFDRKYAFELPGPEERAAWWNRWNAQAALELRIEASTLEHMVTCTEGFSFAYLQELCLSGAMRWMEDPRPMASVLEECVLFLRKQMRSEGSG